MSTILTWAQNKSGKCSAFCDYKNPEMGTTWMDNKSTGMF